MAKRNGFTPADLNSLVSGYEDMDDLACTEINDMALEAPYREQERLAKHIRHREEQIGESDGMFAF